MSAPTVSEPPELPTFPSGPGQPDQPAAFFSKFLLFLAWLTTFRTYLVELIAYLESIGGSSSAGGGSTTTNSLRWNVSNTDEDAYTISESDIGAHKRFTTDTGAELNVPLVHGFVVGDRLKVTQAGLGSVVITAMDPSVIVNSLSGALVSEGQGAVFEMEYVGDHEWDASGDLTIDVIATSGDATDGDDTILLSGDMTDGDDIEATSGA